MRIYTAHGYWLYQPLEFDGFGKLFQRLLVKFGAGLKGVNLYFGNFYLVNRTKAVYFI